MNPEDLILVSVDDHLIEPPNAFEGRLPRKFADQAPRVVQAANGAEVWVFGDESVPNIGLNAVAGRKPEEYGMDPTRFAEMRPGCYEVDERVRDMSAGGVLASLCFPSFVQFCGQLISRCKDRDLAMAVVRAYNDFHVEGWCGAHPGRFIPLGLVPLWDPELMAQEVRRLDAMDCHAVSFSANPARLGYPSLHSDFWDPFWAVCDELGTVVCMHLGSSSEFANTADDAPVDVSLTLNGLLLASAAADIVWSPICRLFPNIKFALSEGGIGWIPYFLEKVDLVYQHHSAWTNQDFGDRQPSDVFREHVVTCFIEDRTGLQMRDTIGVHHITWESDYPHSDSTWPMGPERFVEQVKDLSREEIDLISHQNALRVFRFDPFKHIPREQATVGALRASAADVDLSFHEIGRKEFASGPVPASVMADIASQLARG